jgi:hypothetical protein
MKKCQCLNQDMTLQRLQGQLVSNEQVSKNPSSLGRQHDRIGNCAPRCRKTGFVDVADVFDQLRYVIFKLPSKITFFLHFAAAI